MNKKSPIHRKRFKAFSLSSLPLKSEIQAESNRKRYEKEFVQLEKLGSGGFGSVYKVENKLDGNFYAMKKIRFKGQDINIQQQIMREVRALSILDHPNVVRYFQAWLEEEEIDELKNRNYEIQFSQDEQVEEEEIWEEADDGKETEEDEEKEGDSISQEDTTVIDHGKVSWREILNSMKPKKTTVVYIQMQLCGKETLRDRMENRTESNKWYWLNIFRQICAGLEYIHGKGIIHRDLKPSNIYFTQGDNGIERIVIGDFGLAVVSNNESDILLASSPDTNLSKPLQRVFSQCVAHTTGIGTPAYSSPEQVSGIDQYNYKTDIYSLGIILFELLNLFGTQMERIKALTNARNKMFPVEFVKAYPKESNLLNRMLSNTINDRPPAKKILEELFPDNPNQMISISIEEFQALQEKLSQQEKMIQDLKKELEEKKLELSKLKKK